MNCEKCREEILLRDAGEGRGGEPGDLERHLEQCAECAETVKSLAFVRTAFGTPARVPATPPATLAALKEAAGRGSVSPGPSARFSVRAYPALALAATLLMVLGLVIWGGRLRAGSQSGSDVVARAAVQWSEDVELSLDVMENELDAVCIELDSIVGVEELAREILEMEGGQI
jgi:anti-sigma factor RsiW